jgi:signal transduction histidine kinase
VLGHPERLRRLLENLLANALRFSPPGGTVTLGLALRRARVELWVDDQGPGIPEPQRRQVFERFWQADPSRCEAEHHGLGLSIAQAIAQAHHGRLLALAAPGGGARLLLELPTVP